MNKKIKIAVVSSSFPPYSSGGVSSAQYGLLITLKKNINYDVVGFTFADKKDTKCELFIRSGTPKWFNWLMNYSFKFFFKIIDRGLSAYQCSDIFSNLIGSFKAAIKIKKFSPDIIFISDHGAPMFFIKNIVTAKYVWCAHHNPMRFVDNSLIGRMSRIDAEFATSIEKKCLKKCSSIVSPSIYMKDLLKETHDVYNKSYVIKNIMDLNLLTKYQNLKENSILNNKEKIKIFIPSAGSSIKGERYIFSIMLWLSSLNVENSITFVLSGKISEKLNYEIRSTNTLDVICLGQISYEENIKNLSFCNLFISPTLLENFGMAILESLLLGIPVVSFDVGGNKELIVNGKNGYLVEYLNLQELIISAQKLIDRPLSKIDTINSTKSIYSIDEISAQYDELISTLI